jgi:hypothetical protein
MEKEVT